MEKKVSVVFGTRPEAIKLCPIILALKEHPEFSVHVCVTAQHREMLDQILQVFNIIPDVDLDLISPNQTLAGFTSRAIGALDIYFAGNRPDVVLVQGDTNTVLGASLTAFYHQIPVGHIEAGLRTWNKLSPFPEETNRVLTSHIADFHFAPTQHSKANLLLEGIPEDSIFVTGNTVIDALFYVKKQIKDNHLVVPGVPSHLMHDSEKTVVLITAHRRENFEKLESICFAIDELAKRHPETAFIYPVHLNPNVRGPVMRLLKGINNVFLIDPVGYRSFVALMDRAKIILTDSGGVQEEAPSLGKPVLVMRESTERPEAVEMGAVKLVGTDRKKIVENITSLLTDEVLYNKMASATNPYGDGKACERIISVLEQLPS